MPSKEKNFFSLRCVQTGELVRLNSSAGISTIYQQLTSCPQYPVLELESEEDLSALLMSSTPWYNAHSPDSANWGDFRKEDFVPVRVSVTQEVEELVLPEPLQVETDEVRSITREAADEYAGHALPHAGGDSFACFWLAYLPEGVSLEDANKHVGAKVYANGDRYTGRELLEAIAVPDNFLAGMTKGRGVLLLTRPLGY